MLSVLAGIALGTLGFGTVGAERLKALYFPLIAALTRPASRSFSDTDNAEIQYRELVAYVAATGRPHRVVQVNLERHPKISQFTDIDSSPSGYGNNACGLVAAAAALGGKNWVPLVGTIAHAAGDNYHRSTGIQPYPYVAALQTVLGAQHVRQEERSSLGQLYRELAAGNVVIVDIKVRADKNIPSASNPNYAHFARVLGLDLDRREIYIENTLRGNPYWTVRLVDFLPAWQQPETTSSLSLNSSPENVTRWAVVIDGALVSTQDSS